MRSPIVYLAHATIAVTLGCAGAPPDPSGSAPATPETAPRGAQADAPATPRPMPPRPDVSIACGDETCLPPQECIRFPTRNDKELGTDQSCEIPCDPVQGDEDCPADQRCIPLVEGPGDVCR